MGESPCSEVEIRRAQVNDVARGILEQRIRLEEGAGALAALQPDVDPGEDDPELRFFSELARHFRNAGAASNASPDGSPGGGPPGTIRRLHPLGDERQIRELVARACRTLVARYGAPS